MNEDLYQFFKEWLEWAESPKPEGRFSRRYGLCLNLRYRYLPNYPPDHPRCFDLQTRLERLLEKDFGSSDYPFGDEAYHHRSVKYTQHLDPNRLAWVRKKVQEYEAYAS